jgi:hypothetical protein
MGMHILAQRRQRRQQQTGRKRICIVSTRGTPEESARLAQTIACESVDLRVLKKMEFSR